MTRVAWRMTPPIKRPRLAWHPDVPRTAEEAEKQLEDALKASLQRIACPVCGETWPESDIARHASACGVSSNKDTTVQQWAAIFPPTKKPQRIPPYKMLDSMPIAVDAFRYGAIEGCSAYFLSHFHSDHYAGLSKRWAHGPIYCTRETAKLAHDILRVDPAWLRMLDLDTRTPIPEVQDVHVTCLAANHCPGSCLFLFEGPRQDGKMARYLHCGDFRACPAQATHKAIQNACPLDAIYLDAYFLSHFHSDHYAGLSKRWAHGPIYCTRETAKLAHDILRVDPAWLRMLDLDTRTPIPEVQDVHVTCLAANHCPGSCLFLFEGPRQDGKMARYLHCGDFRACPAQATHKAIRNACPLDAIYLDTTYLNPQYCFPPQPQVIKACADLVTSKTSPLVVVGTYSIGKERLFLALAEALDTYIYCVDKRKYHTYALLDDTTLQKRLTKDPLLARVHVMPLRALVPNALQTYADALQKQGLTIAQTLAFRPTGWTSRQTRQQAPPPKALTPQHIVPPPFTQRHLHPTRHGSVQMYAVPYSEHSSFYELMAFLLHVPHHRMIPTVPTKFQRYADVWTAASLHQGHVQIEARSTDYW